MPEYILPGKDSPEFTSLPGFAQGYIEAAFFTAPDGSSEGDPDLSGLGFPDLSPAALQAMLDDCAEFRSLQAAAIDALVADGGPDGTYDEAAAGRDYWYSRNGHGVGYWDRGFTGRLADVADWLTDAASARGEVDLDLDEAGMVCEL